MNFHKRNIIRQLKKYSLISVINCCNEIIAREDFFAKWIIYLIIKWKFIATDRNKNINSGKFCSMEIIEKWANDIWRSSSNIESPFHSMRRMTDIQLTWQKEKLNEAMFFPTFIDLLDISDSVRKKVLGKYNLNTIELGLLVYLVYSSRTKLKTALMIAKYHSQNMEHQLTAILDNLTFDYRDISSEGLNLDLGYEAALSSYLASINIEKTSSENIEAPWIESYPIVKFDSNRFFLLDENLWQRRIATYFYEKLVQEYDEDNIGLSFEKYCKNMIAPYFTKYQIITSLPKKMPNADMVTEDDQNFYIFEIKHKKYDRNLYSMENAVDLSKQLENQIIHGYSQIKSTSENIDNKRNIFKHHKKPINKNRVGFLVTERSYMIGSGLNFQNLFGAKNKISDHSISDENIYFVGASEMEDLLIASKELNITLAEAARIGFSNHSSMIRMDEIYKNNSMPKNKSNTEIMMEKVVDLMNNIIKTI